MVVVAVGKERSKPLTWLAAEPSKLVRSPGLGRRKESTRKMLARNRDLMVAARSVKDDGFQPTSPIGMALDLILFVTWERPCLIVSAVL